MFGKITRSNNIRQAYRKLRSRFMGEDVQHLLCTRAEATLDKIRFDGSSTRLNRISAEPRRRGTLVEEEATEATSLILRIPHSS